MPHGFVHQSVSGRPTNQRHTHVKQWLANARLGCSITFGDGSGASGIVFSDTVTVGETQVTGQIVEFANNVNGFNDGSPEDGILGLGFDQINTGLSASRKQRDLPRPKSL